MTSVTLTKFAELAKNKGSDYTQPPYRVPAGELDKNFKKLTPQQPEGTNRSYSINATDDGWNIVPEVFFDVCENGTPVRYKFLAERLIS